MIPLLVRYARDPELKRYWDLFGALLSDIKSTWRNIINADPIIGSNGTLYIHKSKFIRVSD